MNEITNRKRDHIDFTEKAIISASLNDSRFYYEPLLSGHPKEDILSTEFLGKKLKAPIWISSMTGGCAGASEINKNLARVASEFGLGMGLGSCRTLLEDSGSFSDFNLRDIIGESLPFYANLGIAQIEDSIDQGKLAKIKEMLKKLEVDGLIIHVNPLQEWFQGSNGDRFKRAPIENIKRFLDSTDIPLIIKEVGQGIGPGSLKELLKLPIEAIEFAAFGGTNFSKMELMREQNDENQLLDALSRVGHTAFQMVDHIKNLVDKLGDSAECSNFIISGGINSFLDGHYLIERLGMNAVYGQASAFLKYADGPYEKLYKYVHGQIEGLKLSKAFLKVKED